LKYNTLKLNPGRNIAVNPFLDSEESDVYEFKETEESGVNPFESSDEDIF
jgi:hypothetical protein